MCIYIYIYLHLVEKLSTELLVDYPPSKYEKEEEEEEEERRLYGRIFVFPG